MVKTITSEQEKAVQEKIEQLRKIREGSMKAHELAGLITKRRLDWLAENRHLLRRDLPLPEAAYRLIVFEHMKVDGGIDIVMSSNNVMMAIANNFCPYLEACKSLNMDTRFVCREIGEPSISAFFKAVDSRLLFWRDYEHIRPHQDCCMEYLGLEGMKMEFRGLEK